MSARGGQNCPQYHPTVLLIAFVSNPTQPAKSSVPAGNFETSRVTVLRLSHKASLMTADLAIFAAIRHIRSSFLPTSWVICSDSNAALAVINSTYMISNRVAYITNTQEIGHCYATLLRS